MHWACHSSYLSTFKLVIPGLPTLCWSSQSWVMKIIHCETSVAVTWNKIFSYLRAYLASFSSSHAVLPPPKFLLAVFSKPWNTKKQKGGNVRHRLRGRKNELTYDKCNPSTLIKLSVSFRQVWHGAVWTLTTVSSERSTRAGSDDQDHHMILQWKYIQYNVKDTVMKIG